MDSRIDNSWPVENNAREVNNKDEEIWIMYAIWSFQFGRGRKVHDQRRETP
jgi:hypothetical protein